MGSAFPPSDPVTLAKAALGCEGIKCPRGGRIGGTRCPIVACPCNWHGSSTMETLPPDVTPIRKLGFAELRMHLMHHELHGTTQGAAVLRLRGPLEVAAFRQ